MGQHRYTLDEWSWEIPEGGGGTDETPLEGIQREFREETGLLAERWSELMTLHTSNCVTDEKAWIYIATGIGISKENMLSKLSTVPASKTNLVACAVCVVKRERLFTHPGRGDSS